MTAQHSLPLPNEYGYIFAVLAASCIMNIYLVFNVVTARKKYGVDYPALYAPSGHKFEFEFNSVQRAHQNTLESYAFVMTLMCVCGLVHPITSAIYGGLWVFGRFIYGFGYATGGPKGRMAGGIISHLGDFPLMGLTFVLAYRLLTAA